MRLELFKLALIALCYVLMNIHPANITIGLFVFSLLIGLAL